jgi:hypothetical protein
MRHGPILLTSLNAAQEPADMNLPGYRLHQLKGERKGQFRFRAIGDSFLFLTAKTSPMSIWSITTDERKGT